MTNSQQILAGKLRAKILLVLLALIMLLISATGVNAEDVIISTDGTNNVPSDGETVPIQESIPTFNRSSTSVGSPATVTVQKIETSTEQTNSQPSSQQTSSQPSSSNSSLNSSAAPQSGTVQGISTQPSVNPQAPERNFYRSVNTGEKATPKPTIKPTTKPVKKQVSKAQKKKVTIFEQLLNWFQNLFS